MHGAEMIVMCPPPRTCTREGWGELNLRSSSHSWHAHRSADGLVVDSLRLGVPLDACMTPADNLE